MAYTPFVWKDDPTGGTPITAQRLNALESGLSASSVIADNAATAVAAANTAIATANTNISTNTTNISTNTSGLSTLKTRVDNIVVANYGGLGAANAAALPNGTYVGQFGFTTDGAKTTYRWNGAWKPWDSDWIGYTPTFTGLSGTAYQSPGWLPGGRYRYTGGKIRFEFGLLLNTAMTPSGIGCSIPVAADQYGAFNNGGTAPLQAGLAVTGRAWRNSGRYYDWAILWTSSTTIGFMSVNSAQYMDGQGGGSWAQSDTMFGVMEYDI